MQPVFDFTQNFTQNMDFTQNRARLTAAETDRAGVISNMDPLNMDSGFY